MLFSNSEDGPVFNSSVFRSCASSGAFEKKHNSATCKRYTPRYSALPSHGTDEAAVRKIQAWYRRRKLRHKFEDFLYKPPAKKHQTQIKILYANTGGGHYASAVSLEAAFRKHYQDKVDVTAVDFMQHAGWPLNEVSWYKSLVDSSLYKFVYDLTTHDDFADTHMFQFSWYWTQDKVCEFVNSSRVDVFISVHPLIHHYILSALEAWEDPPLVVTVVTDLASAHPSWFAPKVSMLFVPTDHLAKMGQKLGIDKTKINVCGLPLREGFWYPEKLLSKPDARQKLNLEVKPGMAVVLVMGGGDGFGDLLGLAKALESKLTNNQLGKMVVICGSNTDLKSNLEHETWCATNHTEFIPRILGFVPNIHEYMCASDCLVTKAGPGSIAEGMSVGLPMLLTFKVPGL